MAAGLGFKTFTTGEVLTAGDVNGYLMQGINVFASNAARDAAITSPQEGQFAYTKDTNSLWYYTGSAWAASGATGDIEGVSVTSPITGGGTSGTVTIGIDSTAVVPSQTGNSGKYLTTNGTSSSWATVSSGTTWTQKGGPSVFGTSVITTMAYNGTNLYAVGTYNGTLFTSPDLVTWTSRTSGFGSNGINRIIYENSLWVAVGNLGLISTSTDGVTWTARTSNMSSNDIFDVTYGNSLFVAVGDGGNGGSGGVTTSPDGATWTKRTTPTLSSAIMFSVAYGNGYFVAVGQQNTVCGIYSTNGTTWTALAATANFYASVVSYQNGNWFIFATAANGKYQATNPTGAWTNINGNNTLPTMGNYSNNYASNIAVSGGKFYFNPASYTAYSMVGVWDTNLSGTGQTTTLYSSIPAPFTVFNSGGNYGQYYSIYVNSSGGILLGTAGRILSSF